MQTVDKITHPTRGRLEINQLGLWLFFLSESMIFLVLLMVRFFLLGATRPIELNQALGLGLTVILLISSLTAYRSEVAIRHGDRRLFQIMIASTFVLGVAFLLGVVILEWSEAPHLGIVPQSGYGVAFFSMTGLHAFHVFTGVIMLAVVFLNGRRGAYAPDSYWGVEATVKYWHFVDLVWVFFYPALYLVL